MSRAKRKRVHRMRARRFKRFQRAVRAFADAMTESGGILEMAFHDALFPKMIYTTPTQQTPVA